MDAAAALDLYRVMLTARQIDRVEQELTQRGEAAFHISGAGHEGSAALAWLLNEHDWLHCHYRSRALLLARGVSPRNFLDNVLCKDNSSSRGRQMSAFFSDPRLNLLSMVTPVGNNALQSVGVAAAVVHRPGNPVVVCGVGDGTTQQGEFLEACAEAARRRVPVLFLIEDNRWAISTSTVGKTFYSLPGADGTGFLGLPLQRVDARDAVAVHGALEPVVRRMRATRRPEIVVLEMERLTSHTNADDQRAYRRVEELQQVAAAGDPLRRLEQWLLAQGYAPSALETVRQEVVRDVAAAEAAALGGPEPQAARSAKRPLPVELTHPSHECRGRGERSELTIRDALNEVLRHHLRHDERVTLLGQDIEDPKGDVFGVTRGLSTEFPGRVCNAPLSESTILGVSIGRALAGERPVAFVQFADFLPLAHNQITSELATIYWRSGGQWNAPVIVLAACGGYRPGLGPYHAQTMESALTHTPGLDVLMPSSAADAAGLLNAAFRSERPTLLLYPKACLNDPKLATSPDVAHHLVPLGAARKVRPGRDITLVGWGNTLRVCLQTAEALEKVGLEAEVLDLRSLSPWDERAVLASAERTARLIVVHEDNHTCGMGAEILATVAQKARMPVALRRVTRPDTFVPCNFTNQLEILPSLQSVLTTAAELLDLELTWQAPPAAEPGLCRVEAIGSGPADETVIVVELLVAPGATVQRGQALVSLEATKSVFELSSPADGTVEEILVRETDTVPVGQPLLTLRTASAVTPGMAPVQETPVLRRKPSSGRLRVPQRASEPRRFDVGISTVATVEGSRVVSNTDLLKRCGDHTAADILRRTGIEQRRWAREDEDAAAMAVQACHRVLQQENLILDDIDMLVCSTTSPTAVTPSMACQILHALGGGRSASMMQAFDINAACSGYLYALQAGYDYLQSVPYGRVLVVTGEVLSPLLDPEDFDTAILFGDAASATVLYGEGHFHQARARLFRPELSAKGDAAGALSVPLLHDGFIQMHGRVVFSEAVRTMIASLTRACARQGIDVNDLNLVVPHQANQRILDAIQSRITPPVFSNIRHHGNTSSSSIPLCLSELLPARRSGDRLGLCAFGGGFTFGASVLELN